MRRFFGILSGILTAIVILSGCNKTPKGIIQPDEMARLLADTYMLEGVIDTHYRQYNSDSARLLLKSSLYVSRGYTQEQVDTSFAWYGRNIEVYIDVCDKAIEILEKRQHDLALANVNSVSVVGDSVDVWPLTGHLTVGKNMPTRFITFDIPADSNWQKGDLYELRYKLINVNRSVKSRLLVDYTDGMTDYNESPGLSQGTARVKLRVDSTRVPTRLYGYLDFGDLRGESFHVDSILLIRTRKKAGANSYIATRRFKWGNNVVVRDTSSTQGRGIISSRQQFSDDMPLPPGIIQ